MDCIKHFLHPNLKDIEGAENEQVALVFKMFDIIYDYMNDIVNTSFGGNNSKLAILGGIMLNCDGDGNDMFLPLKFEVRTKT